MSQEYLGLFDTPPDRQEIRFGLVIVGLLGAALLLILPFSDIRVREIDAFVPIIDTIMFLSDLIIATLLYAQASVFRSRALTVLASAYLFKSLLIVAHALTFPGAFTPGGLLGAGLNTTAWIFIIRRAAFPIAVMLYVLLRRADSLRPPASERPAAGINAGVLAAIVLAAAVTMLATVGQDLLPSLFLSRRDAIVIHVDIVGTITLLLVIVAMAVLFRRRKSVLDMWLLVALSGWLVQILLNLAAHDRFTIGFYFEYVLLMSSTLIVMLALIVEANRTHARLAISTAARKRERDVRLMSMDGVTAAISHEVGQPLTVVSLNTSAALNLLTQPRPDVERAITSLRAVSNSAQRTFDVIKSIRAVFARGPGPATEFSLNELVRETASLMDMELSAKKASLELALDDAIPPILADRVQMQRVLVNLFSNAIESLGATRKRPRHIAIRSAMLDGKGVLLEVSDTGIGIAPEEMEHIFDAFFTTKATGTGLGLSLCRTIVEEHGGRLWASPGEECGVTFHLQLPNSSMP